MKCDWSLSSRYQKTEWIELSIWHANNSLAHGYVRLRKNPVDIWQFRSQRFRHDHLPSGIQFACTLSSNPGLDHQIRLDFDKTDVVRVHG